MTAGRPPVGRQRWADLLFLHWRFEPAALRPLVPAPLELDLWEGDAWVSLIPFETYGLRPPGLPESAGLDFLETNVRTYVRLAGGGAGVGVGGSAEPTAAETAVYFFSLDAASASAVAGARVLTGLPYFRASMGVARDPGGEVRYEMLRASSDGRLHVRYRIEGVPEVSRPGTLQHFLIERYRLYVARGPALQWVDVRHEPYRVQGARVLELEETLLRADGIPAPDGEPVVHFSPGVDVRFLAPGVARRDRAARAARS